MVMHGKNTDQDRKDGSVAGSLTIGEREGCAARIICTLYRFELPSALSNH